jgi:putative methyltransferase (TIGR04325 family)
MFDRRLIKQFVPPILLPLLRGRSTSWKPRFIWRGIYSHRRDVPIENNSYDDTAEVQAHYDWTRKGLDLVRAGKPPYLRHEVLAVVAAMTGVSTGAVRILDFGGAVGSGYVQVLGALPKGIAIQYHVVDLPKMCAAGRHLFANDPRITFHTCLQSLDGALDIVYASAVFPYIDDYPGILRQLASTKASFILLGQLAAGDFPTFAARQMNLGKKILAYWFLNRNEIVPLLAKSGYELVYEGTGDREYDQSNFPDTHRIGRMRNMLFRRS